MCFSVAFIISWFVSAQQANTYTTQHHPCVHSIPSIPSRWCTNLLLLQVLLALQRLVNALGPDSPGCYTLLLPILQQCTSIHQVCCSQPGLYSCSTKPLSQCQRPA